MRIKQYLCLGGWLGLSGWMNLAPVWAASTVAQTPASTSCSAQLGATIDRIIQQPSLNRAHWGILVQSLRNPSLTLYQRNADQLFLPASNAKLLTTAAALIGLTPQFQRQTPIFATGQPPTLQNLQVVGQGDPSLSDQQLETVAVALRAKGVQRINTLQGDDTLFQGNPIVPSWDWSDIQGGDGLPINSLMLNGNVLTLKLSPQELGQPLRLQWLSPTLPSGLRVTNRTLTVKSSDPEFQETILEGDQLVVQSQLHRGAEPDTIEVPIARPGLFFLERFRAILLSQGIQVGQIALAAIPGDRSTPIAALPFPPLSTLLAETNQKSNNFYAEALLRLLGVTRTAKNPQSQPSGSTLEQGLRRLQELLGKVGVDPQGYQLADGSGLSRQNLSSPRAIVQTLVGMDRSPYAQPFRASLAVAGTSGTLRQRFQGTVVVNNLQGKTGTLKGTAALSGYLNVPADRPIVFSIIANHSTQPNAVLRRAIDQIVLAIAQQPNAKNCTVFTPLSTALVAPLN